MIIRYFKGEPNTEVIRYRRGSVAGHGPGVAFWYWPYNTSIAVVPTGTQNVHFIFNEATKDFQAVAIQGNLVYRLNAPLESARSIDFTVDLQTHTYRSKDPEKLAQRLIDIIQANTRAHVIGLSLEEALTKVRELATRVLADVAAEKVMLAFTSGLTAQGTVADKKAMLVMRE